MFSLRSLFTSRRPLRNFALLDAQGICRAFHLSAQAPVGVGWIEVSEQRLAWLHRPLPSSARIAPVVTHSAVGKALAA